jgi:flagellar biosynthetic protein FliR
MVAMPWSIAQAQIFLLIFMRIVSIIMTAPVLSTSKYPEMVRIGLGAALAAMLVPLQDTGGESMSTGALAAAAVLETTTGLLIGFTSSLTFHALQVGVSFLGLQSGFRGASGVNPALAQIMDQQGSSMEAIYSLLIPLVFLITNGHHWLIAGMQRSFEVVPVGQLDLSAMALERLIVISGALFRTALVFAFPILSTLLLVDLALAIVARAVPQIQVFFVGLPLKMGVTLVAVVVALPWMINVMGERLSGIMYDMMIMILP